MNKLTYEKHPPKYIGQDMMETEKDALICWILALDEAS